MVTFLETPDAIDEDILRIAEREILHAEERSRFGSRFFEVESVQELAHLRLLRVICGAEFRRRSHLQEQSS
jgi:hypothetical protein